MWRLCSRLLVRGLPLRRLLQQLLLLRVESLPKNREGELNRGGGRPLNHPKRLRGICRSLRQRRGLPRRRSRSARGGQQPRRPGSWAEERGGDTARARRRGARGVRRGLRESPAHPRTHTEHVSASFSTTDRQEFNRSNTGGRERTSPACARLAMRFSASASRLCAASSASRRSASSPALAAATDASAAADAPCPSCSASLCFAGGALRETKRGGSGGKQRWRSEKGRQRVDTSAGAGD